MPKKAEGLLESLPLAPGERCYTCGYVILWGEPYGMAEWTCDTVCGGCAVTPLFRNGPSPAADTACIQLRRALDEVLEERYELLYQREEVETALGFLEDVAQKDICPWEVKHALRILKHMFEYYPTERQFPR